MLDKGKNYSIEEIQKELLELLKRFHDFCVKNEIKYSLYAGTLLGAVREKGFIPWDDDVDVSFMREEYNKFLEAIKKCDLGGEMAFEEYSNAFPQLWMHREGKPPVWIDCFIYDYITENKFLQKIKLLGVTFYLGIMKNKKTIELTKTRGLYKGHKMGIVYILYFLGKPFSDVKKHKAADRFHQKFSGNKKLIHRANDRFVGVNQIHPKSVMEHYELTAFEDTEFMITTDYHKILISSYDEDYMTPKKIMSSEADIHNINRMII